MQVEQRDNRFPTSDYGTSVLQGDVKVVEELEAWDSRNPYVNDWSPGVPGWLR